MPTEYLRETDRGKVLGLSGRKRGVCVFRGIPFAAAPVGDLRWLPAREAAGWTGVRPARVFGPVPPQTLPPPNSLIFQSNYAEPAPRMSEDCLYLNVWAPAGKREAGRPVVVWVQGGANRFGWGSQRSYDGERLAARGVVVVTFNYRIGALGFLAHPELSARSPDEASGHAAMSDMLAALHWVRRNIAQFGGDPAQVTLAGSSVGAGAVSHLMAAPKARGLFARAIGQSNSGFATPHRPVPALAQAEQAGVRFAERLGLRTAQDLLGAEASTLVRGFYPAFVVDGAILTEDTRAVFERGEQAPIPLLAGWNADEGSLYTKPETAAEFIVHARELGELGEQFLTVYPAGDEREALRSNRASTGDRRLGWRVWKWASTHARTSPAPVYLYHFSKAPPLPAAPLIAPPGDGGIGYGAFHTAELGYTWDNLATRDWEWTGRDRELAVDMADAWVRFIDTGDPNGGVLPLWNAMVDADSGPVLDFGEHAATAGPVPRADGLALQDRLIARQVSP